LIGFSALFFFETPKGINYFIDKETNGKGKFRIQSSLRPGWGSGSKKQSQLRAKI
jgi:hypothetical protein